MEIRDHVARLSALGHEGRLSVFRLLARRAPRGACPGEFAESTGVKPSTLSTYLSSLSGAGLIESRKRGKSIQYTVNLNSFGELIDYLVADCCNGRPDICAPRTSALLSSKAIDEPSDKVFNVLFLCTGNSARSIFSEAILNDVGKGGFRAFSAGTNPSSTVNPHALRVLARAGHDPSNLRPKGIDAFHGGDIQMDFVFTVCGNAADEGCPAWLGPQLSAHWNIPDPVKFQGSESEQILHFAEVYRMLSRRILAFANLPLDRLDRISLQREIDRIDLDGTK